MEDIIFNVTVGIVTFLLIIFLLRQQNFDKKLGTIILVASAAIMLIVNKPLIWLSVFVLIIACFAINSLRHKSAHN